MPAFGKSLRQGAGAGLLALALALAAAGCEQPATDPASSGTDAAGSATAEAVQADPGDAGYAERMAAEHAGDSPVPAAAAAVAPAGAVEETTVAYAVIGGKPVQGFLARPAGREPGGPALIVIQEWWGLNDNIRDMARRLAGEGYTALAVDLYRGQVAETPERARELMQAAMADPAPVEDNLRQARAYLTEQAGAERVGSIGWCFGGGWSLQAALLMPDGISAAVIYYGRLVTDPQQLAALKAPILGVFGSEDQGIPVAGVRAFQAALEKLGKPAEIKIYEGADHAFANPSGTRYDAAATEDAWALTLAFLQKELRPEAAD